METIKGIYLKEKHPNAPDFVLAKGWIKIADLQKFLSEQPGETINFDVLRNKEGKPYIKIDTWKPDQK
jgi:hypothetical protein